MAADSELERIATSPWLYRWRDRSAAATPAGPGPTFYTIAAVSEACGLPGPVIMQLVPRTWTAAGWQYTGEQIDLAVRIAADLRRARAATP